jgi:23S rRNA (guanosine2251-2'-O)-methyltransferase
LKKDTIFISGPHAVRSALLKAPELCLEIWASEKYSHSPQGEFEASLTKLVLDSGLTLQLVRKSTLDRLYDGAEHQGIVLRRRPPPEYKVEQILDDIREPDGSNLLLVLDRVQDPRNYGACLRAADNFGVAAVIVPKHKSCPITGVVASAASGALDSVKIVEVTNLTSTIKKMREAGIWITGAKEGAPLSLYKTAFNRSTAIVVGGEGFGLRRLTRENCDELVSIPMDGFVSSLNVSTAAAICLYEFRRQYPRN